MKKKENKVFIATSLDGFIADKDGGIGWLDTFPEINNIDSGYVDFTSGIDALVMGRITFETVVGFDIDWPYEKPVFVVSNSITEVPTKCKGKVQIVNGNLTEILTKIHSQGFNKLYIDGGKLIQSFLNEDLIDEMVITVIPVLLGEGHALFSQLTNQLVFKCVEFKLFLKSIVQNHYRRERD